jgi:NADPH2:quinone reductase
MDVRAAGVVYGDVLKTRGLYQERPELPFVLGQECAGVVRSAPTSSGLGPGDRVAAFTPQGAFYEVVAVDAGLVLPLPERLPFAEAAALPLNYLTAPAALAHRGQLAAGETVLVHGAAGGIGTASIQLAKAHGARDRRGV